jgi:hypothetical protein
VPAFGCNPITIAFAEVVLEKQRVVSGDGSEEDPYVYERIGFRLTDRIISALDRFIGALSRFRPAGDAGVLDRWLFLYPFVGGVDWVHSLNLADLDGNFEKFTITWSGAVTHNQNGVTFAAGGKGNTGCDCADSKNNFAAWNRKSFGLYSRTNSAVNSVDMYAGFTEPRNGYAYSQGIYPRYGDGICYCDLCYYSKAGVATTPNRAQVAVADSLGLISNTQRGPAIAPYHYIHKKGVYIAGENTGEVGMGYGDGLGLAMMIFQGTRNWAFAFSTKHPKALEYPGLPGSNADFNYFVQQLQVALLRNV